MLAIAALLLGVGVAVATSVGGDDPASKRTSTSAAKERQSTAGRSSSSSGSTPTPAPAATATTPAKGTPATTKSRAALIAQNDRAFAATDANPAGQVAPLQEAVAGLCTDESDINCAFALYNLGRALRLADRPGEAISPLERRLAISDYKEGEVRQELAAAQQAAGAAPSVAAPGGSGGGKSKANGKGKGANKG